METNAGKGSLFVGIDVGGEAKGFHLATLLEDGTRIHSLLHAKSAGEMIHYLEALQILTDAKVTVIAVDSPSQPWRESATPRSAERELVRDGYRVFWTPVKNAEEKYSEWMEQGAALMRSLASAFPEALVFESFPTASFDGLFQESDAVLPLSLLAGSYKRKFTGDYIDASILAVSAYRYAAGGTRSFGVDDELGSIQCLDTRRRVYTLCIVEAKGQILLGMKKRGFGEGKWNGFGGKLEQGETLEEGAVRELEEEACVRPVDLEKAAIIRFTFDNDPILFEGHIYHVREITGEPGETSEMRPAFFPLDRIPYEEMWDDDRIWLPIVLSGGGVIAHFHFTKDDTTSFHSVLTVERKSLQKIPAVYPKGERKEI